jgi:hypothetical protein
MAADLITLVWTDQYYTVAQSELYVPNGGDDVTLVTALQAQSAASAWAQYRTVTEIPPNPGPQVPSDVTDAARLIFVAANGQTCKIIVPSPVASTWQADGETVNPTAIAALVNAVLTYGSTRGGIALTALVGGYRCKIPVPPVGTTTGAGR